MPQANATVIATRAALRVKYRPQVLQRAAWEPESYQRPPDADWLVWALIAGRGVGKTLVGAHMVLEHLREFGAAASVAIGAPTLSDVRTYCAEGETGLITIAPQEFPTWNRSLLEARHRDGGFVKFLGSEEPNRWRGGNWTLLWADELATWNPESWTNADLALRIGTAKKIITTTPRPTKIIKQLVKDAEDPATKTFVTRASTYDNPHLPEHVRERWRRRYEGTRLGRQELMGEIIEDVEGALWQRDWIDENRVDQAPDLERIVVAIDPAVTHGEDADETGIDVSGRGVDGEFYGLHNEGVRLSPHGWAKRAVDLYDQYDADLLIAERNNGGEMVEANIRAVRPNLPVSTIVATRGKVLRAEPVANLYEQGRVHHVGNQAELEDQLCSFGPDNAIEFDDRLDARVYAITELIVDRKAGVMVL